MSKYLTGLTLEVEIEETSIYFEKVKINKDGKKSMMMVVSASNCTDTIFTLDEWDIKQIRGLMSLKPMKYKS